MVPHNSAQFLIPIPVQPQLSTATFPSSMPALRRDLSDSTIASVDQPSHLFPSSEHHQTASSANIQNLVNEPASKAASNKKKKMTEVEYRDRIGRAQLAYGGSANWCHLYRSVPLGSLPTKDEFDNYPPPPAFELLLQVPIQKARKNSEVAHFFVKDSKLRIHSPCDFKYNFGIDGTCSESDDDSINNNNDDTDNNSNNNNNNEASNVKRVGKDKTEKNSSDRFRCQMVFNKATATEPELRCGKSYVAGNGTRSRERHMDKHHRGVRTAVQNFRRLQRFVQGLDDNIEDDSNIPICNCGGAKRVQEVGI